MPDNNNLLPLAKSIIESVKIFTARFGAVVWVDLNNLGSPATLERLSKEEGVVGVPYSAYRTLFRTRLVAPLA